MTTESYVVSDEVLSKIFQETASRIRSLPKPCVWVDVYEQLQTSVRWSSQLRNKNLNQLLSIYEQASATLAMVFPSRDLVEREDALYALDSLGKTK